MTDRAAWVRLTLAARDRWERTLAALGPMDGTRPLWEGNNRLIVEARREYRRAILAGYLAVGGLGLGEVVPVAVADLAAEAWDVGELRAILEAA